MSNENGEYHVEWSEPDKNRAIRIEADGYYPSAAKFLGDRKQTIFNIELKKGKSITGIVHSPDGKLLANAEVALCTPGRGCAVNNGRLTATGSSLIVRSGADGSFAFPPQSDHFIIVAAHNAGFAQVGDADNYRDIVLQPWARVEGTVTVGNKPGAKEWMDIVMHEPAPALSGEWRIARRIAYNFEAPIGADGHFVFEGVTPGYAEIIRILQEGPQLNWEVAQRMQIEMVSGRTSHVDFGDE